MGQTDQQRQDGLVITACVLTGVSFIVVCLRTFTRVVLVRKPGVDDYTMLAAMFFSCGYFAEIIVGKYNKIGHAMTTITFDNMQNLIKTTLAIECTYYACVTFVKISILCMYLRFAVNRTLRMLCIGTVVFHSLFFVVCLTTTLAQCHPLEKMWDLLGTVDGYCINTTAFFYFTSGLNIITDIFILVLPVKTLLHINRPQKEKIALVCIFGVGTFATIMSIIRLHTIYTYTLAKDPFQESILVNLWSIIEVNSAIVCASVPALKPLFTPAALAAARQGSTPQKHTDYEYHSGGKSGVIKSKKSVDQSWSTKSFNLGPIPSNTTKISSGRDLRANDSDSAQEILKTNG